MIPQKKRIWIPYPCVINAWNDGLKKAFSLYLLLKMYTSGTVHKKSGLLRQIRADYYKNSQQTYYNHLDKLLLTGWIWLNKRRNILHINSFAKVMYNSTYSSQRYLFKIEYIPNTVEFMFSSIITHKLINTKNFNKYVGKPGRRARRIERSLSIPFFSGTNNYFGLSTKTISELTHLSHGMVYNLKRRSVQARYLSINNKYEILAHNPNEIVSIKSVFPEFSQRITIRKKKVVFLLHDEIKPLLTISRRSKRDTFVKLKLQEAKKNYSKKLKQI